MPEVFLVVILILLIIIAIEIVYFLQIKNKYQKHVRKLEQDVTNANTLVQKQVGAIANTQGTTEFEKYAGLVISQFDHGVIVIHQNRTVRVINENAKKFLDLSVGLGQKYQDVFSLRIDGKPEIGSIVEEAFKGVIQKLPIATELSSPRGSFPITGAFYPILSGQAVGAVVFIFEDSSKQVAHVKEEQAFFSAAAHELRTPLTIIRMTVALLKDKFETLPKEKIAEHLRRTDETTERLVKLVNDFLNISRMDQGRLEINITKFDVIALIDEVITNLEFLSKERNLFVHHEVNISERNVSADRAKTTEILTNLITNGLKFTVQGGVTITHEISDTSLVTIISDTGAGIPLDTQGLLFKRYGQVGEARELQTTKSTGLGLYISRRLARLMRGDVTLVKSEPGKGSTFAFTLQLG